MHFGLPIDMDVDDMKLSLLEAIKDGTLAVPPKLRGLRLYLKLRAGDNRPSAPMEIEQIDEPPNLKFENSNSDSEQENEDEMDAASVNDDEHNEDDSYHDEGSMEVDDDLDDDAEGRNAEDDSANSDILDVHEPNEQYRKMKERAQIDKANRPPRKKRATSNQQHLNPVPIAAQRSVAFAEASTSRQASSNQPRTNSRQTDVEVVIPTARKASNDDSRNLKQMSSAATGLLSPVSSSRSQSPSQLSSPFTPDTLRILDSRQQKHKAAVKLGNDEEPRTGEPHRATKARRKTAKKTKGSSTRVTGETTVRADEPGHDTPAQDVETTLQPSIKKHRDNSHQIRIAWPTIYRRHPLSGPPITMPHPRIRPKGYHIHRLKLPNLRIQIEMFDHRYSGLPIDLKDVLYLLDDNNGNVQDAIKDFEKFILKWQRQHPEAGVRANPDGTLTYPSDESEAGETASSAHEASSKLTGSTKKTSKLARTAPKHAVASENQADIIKSTSERVNHAHHPTPVLESGLASKTAVPNRVSSKKRKSHDVAAEVPDPMLDGQNPSKKAKRYTESEKSNGRPTKVLDDVVAKNRQPPETSTATHKPLVERSKKAKQQTRSHPSDKQLSKDSATYKDNATDGDANDSEATTLPRAFKHQLQLDAGTNESDAVREAKAALSKGFTTSAREAQLRNQISKGASMFSSPTRDTEMRDISQDDKAFNPKASRRTKSSKPKFKAQSSKRKKAPSDIPVTSVDAETSDSLSDSSSEDSDSAYEDVLRYAVKVLTPDEKRKYPQLAKAMRRAEYEENVTYLRSKSSDQQIRELHYQDEVAGVQVDCDVLGELRKLAMTEAELHEFQVDASRRRIELRKQREAMSETRPSNQGVLEDEASHTENAKEKGNGKVLTPRQRKSRRRRVAQDEGRAAQATLESELAEKPIADHSSWDNGMDSSTKVVGSHRGGTTQAQPVFMSGGLGEGDEPNQHPRNTFFRTSKAGRLTMSRRH